MNTLQPQNFAMRAGDSKILKVTIVDENGVPFALAGTQAVTWSLARTSRSAAVLAKTLADGVTIVTEDAALGGVNCGRLDVVIDSAESEALDGEYFHDCHVVDAGGQHSTVFYGRANVAPNLT